MSYEILGAGYEIRDTRFETRDELACWKVDEERTNKHAKKVRANTGY